MGSTSSLAFVLMLIVGLSIALVSIKDKRSQAEVQQRVQMPKFGGVDTRHKEGPWPACLGMTGEKCMELIASYNSGNIIRIEIWKENDPATLDFRTDRVRIIVDENGIVTTIPNRG
jgi:hypothetical protein